MFWKTIHRLVSNTNQRIHQINTPFLVQDVVRGALRRPVLIIGIFTTGIILGVRQVGWLQPLEIVSFDTLTRLQPKAEEDTRIAIIGITEEDIQTLSTWPISDKALAQVLANLQTHNPKAIGLDIYRDIAYEPGHQALVEQLQAPNIVAVETFGSVPPPPSIPLEQVGFNDLVVDPDNVIRRNLMLAKIDGEPIYSFSLRLSLMYLAGQVEPLEIDDNALRLGKATFQALAPSAGGYQNVDDSGYQNLLRYRSPESFVTQISFTDVLEGDFDPSLVKGRVILIGATAPSAKDVFLTPFSSAFADKIQEAGVVIHAQMVSQVLSAALEGKYIFWFFPNWLEVLWICLWIFSGAWLTWRFQHPLSLVAIVGSSIVGISVISYGFFFFSGWVPFVAPLLGFLLSSISVLAYKRFYDATHDPLTGLPNRSQMVRSIKNALAHNKKTENERLAVFFLSVNRLNIINESFGFNVVDQVLHTVVKRLRTSLPASYQLGRISNKELVILKPRICAVKDETVFADNLIRELCVPFLIDGKTISLSCSTGIAFSEPGFTHQPEDLLRDAHTAMYRARIQGKACHEIFAMGMREETLVRMQLESDMHIAIKEEQFFLVYQPIISLKTGKIFGFEALARWQHPEHGLISPGEFIPVAEETGLIVPLGQWILEQACMQMNDWHQKFPQDEPLLMNVNLSPGQLAQPDIVEQVQSIIETSGINRHSLKLEITESMMMDNVEAAMDLLLRFKGLGLKLGIDDFGTGYSSLSYLTRFPVDTLKVDRSFVSRMEEVGNNAEVVRTIILLGQNLNMDIIAEGVETAAQSDLLKALGCEYTQGFFFAKPLPVDEATALLERDPRW